MLTAVVNIILALIIIVAAIVGLVAFAAATRAKIVVSDIPAEHLLRWSSMNGYAKFITENFKAVRFAIPVIVFVITLAVGLISPTIPLIAALSVSVLITGLYVGMYFRIIPSEDEKGQPNVALPTILSERLPHVLQPGPFLSMPGMTLILYQASVINLDFTIEGVRTRLNSIVDATHENGLIAMADALRSDNVGSPQSGGEVNVAVSLTIEVKTDDRWSLIGLDQAGDLEGAQNIFRDAVAEDVRQIGRHLTWLELEFATDLASAKLIRDLTARKGLKEGEDILINPDEDKIRSYLTQAQVNGFPDCKGLSLKVRRANITKVTAIGELAKAAERAAVEQLKRIGLVENAKAMVEAIVEIKGNLTDGSITEREIYDRIQLDEDGSRVTKTIQQIDLGDPEKVGSAIAAALTAFVGRNNSKGNDS